MTTITRKLVEEDYSISDADVEELVRTRVASSEVDEALTEGYFRVLFKRTISAIVGLPSVESRLAALDKADGTMYPIVLKVINEMTDCQPRESDSPEVKKEKALLRNKRSNYARSAKATIKAAIMAGLEVEDMSAATVGKSALHKDAQEASKVQRSTSEKVGIVFNSLTALMDKLKVEDASLHAHWVSVITSRVY